ncbi:MAG: hypothetical protein QM737_13585 [Ferruginibacter sp.]
MKEKFCLIKAIEATPLQLATIRSLLSNLVYIEIDNNFIVSCSKSFKDSVSKNMRDQGINFILIYVNVKTGCDVFANGLNDNDRAKIKNIVLDNN